MRTAISTAAPPRHLHWQAALAIKAYQTLTPLVWHHTFVSDTHMTNWCGGSDLFLNWVYGGPDGKAKTAQHPERQRSPPRHLTILRASPMLEELSP
jgi:hypothetical protein